MLASSVIALTGPIAIETVFSLLSISMTGYFWFVKARRERPQLTFYQLWDFRATLRRGDAEEGTKRLCVTQIGTGGVLVSNHSSRQNAIVRMECYLKHENVWLKGDWGYTGEDRPPWNISPESSLAVSPACFYYVPETYEVPEDLKFRITFATVSGGSFSHDFRLKAPRI